jgi:2-polyprenyl-3-methyl-5-hydroxy-6-metoxy-1,4-benzoquinol methylase
MPMQLQAVCPLCATSQDPDLLREVEVSTILAGLTNGLGARFTTEVISDFFSIRSTFLVQCNVCGLQYFLPQVPGDERFYAELTKSVSSYYNESKWDFTAVLDILQLKGRSVLDVACGSGYFVALAAEKGAIVRGIDTNPEAVAKAEKLGRPVFKISIEDFASIYPEEFDVVTAFQIVEHIPNFNGLIGSAVRCVKPGGILVVTVPNRLRIFQDHFEPLDHPPHHLSRWTAAQLELLAAQHGLKVQSIHYEPASMHDCRKLLRKWLSRHLGINSDSIIVRAIGRILCGSSLHRLYAKSGLLNFLKIRRMSILAVLKRPDK